MKCSPLLIQQSMHKVQLLSLGLTQTPSGKSLAKACPRPASQQERVLTAIIYYGSLNAQEAERSPIFARHLNSVISSFANKYGLQFSRTAESVMGYARNKTLLNRYALNHADVEKAQRLVDKWRKRRGGPRLDWSRMNRFPLTAYFEVHESTLDPQGRV